MIHFPLRSVREDFPGALPAERTVMILPPEIAEIREDMRAAQALKHDGFTIALEGGCGPDLNQQLLELADVLICDFAECPPDRLLQAAQAGREAGLLLLAKKVETQKLKDQALELGFDLLHGTFFTKSETHSARAIPAAAVSKLKLFDLLLPDEPDFDALAKAIEPDVALTYRLLTFLNSAHFSFAKKITSVHQAVVLGGWRLTRNWLRIILLTDIEPGRKNRELGYMCAHRAKFMETAAMRAGHEGLADALFLCGLFSLLDVIMDLPMSDILQHTSLDEDIRAALVEGIGPYAPWLELANTIEAGNWDELGNVAMKLQLPPGSVAESYRQAFQWADEFFGVADFKS